MNEIVWVLYLVKILGASAFSRLIFLKVLWFTEASALHLRIFYLLPPSNQTAHINCGHCRIILMYPYGASSVKRAVCQYVTNVNMNSGRDPPSMNRPDGTASPLTTIPSTSTTQTVVVENPMSLDESGKPVSNVVVGVTTRKK
ncbi:hypothetical protein N665_0172s0022 [Sinapis alba]|nr:hypothetical protein N665_0172s0022 [Sinapis alba]